jgi:dienelactone hydrolase
MDAERHGTMHEEAVRIPFGGGELSADLSLPDDARGLVIFAHGSGSSRRSPRNRLVAEVLQAGGFATLLADLLTPQEEMADNTNREHRFDIPMLAGRVVAAIDWAESVPPLLSLPIGLFGASTGAAAALVAAAHRPSHVSAVVSRGGRPDLADEALRRVEAPTLLLVGERDEAVLVLNREAMGQLSGVTRLTVIPGATHLFEEPGALEAVARLAREWFAEYLPPKDQPERPEVRW